jgi:hypothetical protein
MINFDKQFVIDNLLNKVGNLNPRALEKFDISSEKAYQVFHGVSGPPACKTCSSNTTMISFRKGYTLYCSKSCASNCEETKAKRRQTVDENYGGYGSPLIQEKKKNTSRQKYGVDWARQSKEFIDGLKEKWQDTHGVTAFSHTPAAVEKRNATNLKKYGVSNPMQNIEIQQKTVATNIEKYGVKSPLMLSENRQAALSVRRNVDVYSLLNDKQWLIANKDVSSVILSSSLGIAFSTILNYYEKYGIVREKFTVSSAEQKMCKFLDSIGVEYQTKNRQILDGKEIDIFIPSHNLGFEIDGIYWHSTKFQQDKYYHQHKTLVAKEKSVQLIHITDYELDNKFDIVKERITNKLGKSIRLYARKCDIVEISSAEYKEFVLRYHIQGYAPASVRYALINEDGIQAVMAFSKSRFNQNYEWELIRYVSKNTVVGGASKLLKHFITTNDPSSIISYADLRWNTGSMYEKIGMNFSHSSSPNYWYHTEKGLEHRSSFQKHKLKNKLAIYDPNKSEEENMLNNGIYRFWDCGNNVYTWGKNTQ